MDAGVMIEPGRAVKRKSTRIKSPPGKFTDLVQPKPKRARKSRSKEQAGPSFEPDVTVKKEPMALPTTVSDTKAKTEPGPSSGKASKTEPQASPSASCIPAKTEPPKPSTRKGPPSKTKADLSAKRAKRFRKKCPVATQQRAERVMSQRMYMVDRAQSVEGEEFKVLGSTGNVYTVRIGAFPTCDCPDCMNGNVPCKHIIFVFLKVLKVPKDSGAWYQRHLLPDELAGVYANAPAAVGTDVGVAQEVKAGYRKAMGLEEVVVDVEEKVDGRFEEGDDCPVCFEGMAASDKLVYDTGTGGCGKPIHKQCFAMWAARGAQNGGVTCVYCRHPWADSKGKGKGKATLADGYVNLASLAGMSGVRDTSSYHRAGEWWTRYRAEHAEDF